MHLERMAAHRVIRVSRTVLPFIIIGLLAVFGWNYWERRNAGSGPPREAQPFPQDLAVLNQGVSFSQKEGGRTVFTVNARTNLGFQDRKQVLQDVEVIVHGQDGSPDRRVTSNEGAYDEQTNDFRFTGDVIVQLDDQTTARTEELTYNYQTRTVISNVETHVEQPGQMTGRSNSLDYGLEEGLLKLAGNVRVQFVSGATLESGSGEFHRNANVATVSDGVYLKSENGWIRGQNGRATLGAQSFQPKLVEIYGGVTAESRAPNSQDTWNLNSAVLRADIGSAGMVEHVWASGDVNIKKASPSGTQLLTANEVDASVDGSGAISDLAARQNARMTFGAGQILSAATIYSSTKGGISTDGDSVLEFGGATIVGRQFLIQQGESTTFNTSLPATLRSGTRETSAESTSARFDGRTNELIELVQTGNFKFREGERRAAAQKATIVDAGKTITLDGAPVVTESDLRLEARQIRLNQTANSFVATENVKTVSHSDGNPVLVTATRAEGDRNSITYTGVVEVWRTDGYIKSELLQVSTRDKSFDARGNVRSDVEMVRATSDRLTYDEANKIAHYVGGVRAQRKDLRIESQEMTAKIAAGELSEITAQGDVVVLQGARRGVGDSALYDAKTGDVTLAGPQAEVLDPAQGVVRGRRLVMSGRGERIRVETAPGERVTSKVKVKQ